MRVFTHLGQLRIRSYNIIMKRIILLCIICAAFIYNLLPQPEGLTQIDQIKTKMAAARGRPDISQAAIHLVSASLVEDPLTTEAPKVSENAAVSEIEPNGSEIAHVDEVPWDEIKQGWKSDLKEFLMEVDPDNGEEIFTAYQEESESFEAEIDSVSQEAEKAAKEARQDFEILIGQLEVKHEEKLKEILGAYYSDVTDRHQQYNSSIQYMNRSDADIVGVSL